MLTSAHHALLVASAGPTFDWPGMGSSRPTSLVRNGLYRFLSDYAASVLGLPTCVFCGLYRGTEAGHVVSSGKGNGSNALGYVPGNIGICCETCNDLDGNRWTVIPFHTIRHPEAIPDIWPSRDELRAIGENVRLEREGMRLEIMAQRGM